jgi:cyclic beta-1,2-glucan synthetase
VATSAIVLVMPLIVLASLGLGSVQLAISAVLGAISAIDAGVALANRGVTVFVGPVPLPGLHLRDGVPESLRTLVAVPTLLTTTEDISEQVERLEIHHLASPEGDLHFALISDWIDADVERTEGDAELVAFARDGIERLNRRYGPAPAGPRFLLLHRRRVWNESERRWIGWERKRGKLHELNRLLRGATDTTFTDMDRVAPSLPKNVRYVVTLDSDTRLPRDTVRQLIGKMAHPLNRPRLDSERNAIVEGYGVLQPRVTPSLPNGGEGSLFQRVFSSSSGIDPYATAVSDVYQDLFCEGSYAGKGIYDLDAFESVLSGRAPDSTLLSHDLFEGTFARAGFASDVELVDDFPSRYDVNARRHHRWARGDWQLLPWILGFAGKGGRKSRVMDELPRIGRWKMIDNLRRTVSAPACIPALALGWTLSFESALVWTTFLLTTIALPSLIPVISAIPCRRPGVAMSGHLRALGRDLRLAVTISALNTTFLADQAWLMGDAIVRTLWRLCVTRRHLLEWTPAAQTTAAKRLDLRGFAVRMSGAFALAGTALLLALLSGHGGWLIATPFVALWVISPAVARYVSLPPRIDAIKISEAQSLGLRQTARRTWRFFEMFVTADDNMLPPDNFQEDPTSQLAHRTSPTNIGLYLLSVVCARDFGWIGTAQTIDRLEATLATMARMPRFRGHFYNWYDTRDLRALDPKYVSSVDSGNLAGHLLAVANACKEWGRSPMVAASRLAGIADTLGLTAEHAAHLRFGRRTQTVTPRQLDDSLAAITQSLASASPSEETLATRLSDLAVEAATIVEIASAIALERSDGSGSDLLYWARASLTTIEAHRADHKFSAEEAASSAARLLVLESASARWRWRWSSVFSSTRRDSCSRSDFSFLNRP